MPTRVPTSRELEVLRYLAAGMRIGAATGPNTHPVIARGVTVIRIQRRTVAAMREAGWIEAYGEQHLLTPAGRAVVDCKTFVRAYAESLSPTTQRTS